MNPYHAWLIRQRKWCEHEGCRMTLTPATNVFNLNGKDYVYCPKHYGRAYRMKHPIETGLRERTRLEQHDVEGTLSNFNRHIAGDR